MAEQEFEIKRNDREPSLRIRLVNADKTAFDLTGYTLPVFHMRQQGETVMKVNLPGVIESPATGGILRYDWAAGDTDTEGVFDAEFRLTSPASKQRTFPRKGQFHVRITPDIDDA